MSDRTYQLQRKCACGGTPGPTGECEECRRKRLQRREAKTELGARRDSSLPPIVDEVLGSPGRALDLESRAYFEPRFGHDFSKVRVHTDARAARSATAVAALAYTAGRNIVFAEGRYAPGTTAGKQLLAHELAHVVQQASTPHGLESVMDAGPSDPFEQAAEARARRVLSNPVGSIESSPRASGRTPPMIQRYTVPASLPCNQVADWMNNNSPYKPEWALTTCNYSFNGDAHLSAPKKVAGGVQRTVLGHPGLTVSVNCSTDSPEWQPSPRPNLKAEIEAWNRMRAVLDPHEATHRAKGEEWRRILEGSWQQLNVTATGKDEAAAKRKITEDLQTKKAGWQTEAQKAQKKLDPFRDAILNCP